MRPWGTRPVITVELDVPKGLDIATTVARARTLARAGVDAFNLAENPLARIRMGNIALASRLQAETGVEVIVHVTGRDRNLLGLHSALMGAHLLGIRSVLAVTGDPVAVGGEGGASNVFDLNSIGLLKLLDALNQGHNLYGAELGGTHPLSMRLRLQPECRRPGRPVAQAGEKAGGRGALCSDPAGLRPRGCWNGCWRPRDRWTYRCWSG